MPPTWRSIHSSSWWIVSGVYAVAPNTPKPPARLTAATTSRQWLKASNGNSMPSMSQIGDFMVIPRRWFVSRTICGGAAGASTANVPDVGGGRPLRLPPQLGERDLALPVLGLDTAAGAGGRAVQDQAAGSARGRNLQRDASRETKPLRGP